MSNDSGSSGEEVLDYAENGLVTPKIGTVRPSRVSLLLVKYPKLLLFIFGFLPLCLSVVGLLYPIQIDYGLNAFKVRDHVSAESYDALSAAVSESKDLRASLGYSFKKKRNTPDVSSFLEFNNDNNWTSVTEEEWQIIDDFLSEEAPDNQNMQKRYKIDPPVRGFSKWKVHLIFLLKEDSQYDTIFEKPILEKIREIYDQFMANQDYQDYCWTYALSSTHPSLDCRSPRSLLPFFFPSIDTKTGLVKPDGKGNEVADIDTAIDNILKLGVYWFTDENFSAKNRKSTSFRIQFDFGSPLEGFQSKTDRYTDQVSILETHLKDYLSLLSDIYKTTEDNDEFVMYYGGDGLTEEEILDTLFTDSALALVSLFLVFCFMWKHVDSLFIAVCGVLQILISFPTVFFVYRVILGIQYVGVLNAISLFLILGIGVDDVFIFYDSFQQQNHIEDLAVRLTLTYKRATKATFITSITTAVAFAVNIKSSIPALRFFGIFMTSLVMINFLICITWFPAVLGAYQRYVTCGKRISITLKLKEFWQKKIKRSGYFDKNRNIAPNFGVQKLRPLEGFFHYQFFGYLKKTFKFNIILVALLFIGVLILRVFCTYSNFYTKKKGSAILASLLQPTSEVPAFFPKDSNIQKFVDWSSGGYFASGKDKLTLDIAFPCDGQFDSGKVVDGCGVCGGDNATCRGCDGIPHSPLKYDVCGVCGGGGTSCLGCDGVPFSKKVIDICGVCGGNNLTCTTSGDPTKSTMSNSSGSTVDTNVSTNPDTTIDTNPETTSNPKSTSSSPHTDPKTSASQADTNPDTTSNPKSTSSSPPTDPKTSASQVDTNPDTTSNPKSTSSSPPTDPKTSASQVDTNPTEVDTNRETSDSQVNTNPDTTSNPKSTSSSPHTDPKTSASQADTNPDTTSNPKSTSSSPKTSASQVDTNPTDVDTNPKTSASQVDTNRETSDSQVNTNPDTSNSNSTSSISSTKPTEVTSVTGATANTNITETTSSSSTSQIKTFLPDPGCDGVPGSAAVVDRCGVCKGNNECVGCDGVPNSGNKADVCGYCIGDPKYEAFDCIAEKPDSKRLININLVWGVTGIDRSQADPNDPFTDYLGDCQYYSYFDFSKRITQEWIIETHDTLLEEGELVSAYNSRFILPVFKKYLNKKNIAFPADIPNNDLTKHFYDFFKSASHLKYINDVGFNPQTGAVSWIRFVFRSKSLTSSIASYEGVQEYERWEEWAEKRNQIAPKTAGDVVQTSDVWVQYFTEYVAVNGIVFGLITSSLVALLGIIVFTGNWIISIFVIMSIASNIVLMLMCFYVFGWSLGVIEAIGITILVGLCVDYVFHVAEAYNDTSSSLPRAERLQDALTRMGISVLSGALTTIAASFMLLFCQIQLFEKLGVILSVNTTLSITLTLLFFTSLLKLAGPEGDKGNIKKLCLKYFGKNKEDDYGQLNETGIENEDL